MKTNGQILVTGGTGYVGGRLIPLLLERGYCVRAMVRSPQKLLTRPWAHHTALEIVPGDALDRASFIKAGEGCSTAYYLIHSMNAHKRRFAEADRRAAENMVACAERNDMQRIIYLGGLGDKDHASLSHHLRSRHEVERILEEGRVPVTNLRAAMILGSGSASFEMLRYLVDRLPVMLTPRWLRTPCQPIAITNVLDYLAGWAGEWGMVVHCNTSYRGPALSGDATFMTATIGNKMTDEDGRNLVQVDVKMKTQTGTTMATAKAEVELPAR